MNNQKVRECCHELSQAILANKEEDSLHHAFTAIATCLTIALVPYRHHDRQSLLKHFFDRVRDRIKKEETFAYYEKLMGIKNE